MLGAAGYFAGIALAVRAETLLQMIGMNGYATSDAEKEYETLSSINTNNVGLMWVQEGI